MNNKHVYLCTPDPPDPKLRPFVAKVQSVPYPWALHEELSSMGLAPKLLDGRRQYPGGVEVIRMEYLGPEDGWTSLAALSGDAPGLDELADAADAALVRLHSCLGGCAVHGDLRRHNVFVRCDPPRGIQGQRRLPRAHG